MANSTEQPNDTQCVVYLFKRRQPPVKRVRKSKGGQQAVIIALHEARELASAEK